MLQQKDITVLDTRMLVHVKGLKTDPFREGVTLSIGKTEASVCPVAAMQAYLACKPPILNKHRKIPHLWNDVQAGQGDS